MVLCPLDCVGIVWDVVRDCFARMDTLTSVETGIRRVLMEEASSFHTALQRCNSPECS
jgi:hypothetical protein